MSIVVLSTDTTWRELGAILAPGGYVSTCLLPSPRFDIFLFLFIIVRVPYKLAEIANFMDINRTLLRDFKYLRHDCFLCCSFVQGLIRVHRLD